MISSRVFAFVVVCFSLLANGLCYGQQPLYKNYSVKDGLASSTVYTPYQDKKGFIWFGTDHGLSRFDGKEFKTFTTSDGLPDNEIFRLEEDGHGRLWMICYNSKPCFIQNSLIHNAENDSLLIAIDGLRLFNSLDADRKGRIWISGEINYLIDGNRIIRFRPPDETVSTKVGYMGDDLMMTTSKALYQVTFANDTIRFKSIARLDGRGNNVPNFWGQHCFLFQGINPATTTIHKISYDSSISVNLYPLGIKQVITGHSVHRSSDSTFLISAGSDGIKAFDDNLQPLPDPYPFLPKDISYTVTMFDRDGNIWITSLEKGVFFIPFNQTIRYKASESDNSTNAISVFKDAVTNRIFTGFDNAKYMALKDGRLSEYELKNPTISRSRIMRMCDFDSRDFFVGADFGVYRVSKQQPADYSLVQGCCVKNMITEGKDSVLAATMSTCLRFYRKGPFFFRDTLFDMRTTAVAKDQNGSVWMGTLNGIYIHSNGKNIHYDKHDILSKRRITDLLCDEGGNMWVATRQRGVFIVTRDSVITLNTKNGMPDDMCVRLYKETDGIMWVCTDRNVARVNYTHVPSFSFEVTPLGELMSEEDVVINDIAIDSASIWLATSNGLLQVEKLTYKKFAAPPVYIMGFQTTDSVYQYFNSIRLPYYRNNVQIDYTGISFNSGGKVAYKYLFGTDTVYTRNTSINRTDMQPGKYVFKVWAKNLAGLWSTESATLEFEIRPPFWRTWWFRVLTIVLLVVAVWQFINWRIKQVREKEAEKSKLNKRLAEVELQAMRAHMNEHFIFNSLNSIQNFVNQNDSESANYYLANFGKLIRRTMDISAVQTISLKEEMEYLENYLMLEKMRFTNKFDYYISNKVTSLSAADIIFPSMILQPFVENAIRHGLRYKTSGWGRLDITFIEENGFIVSTVEDNGIGRKKAAELKSKRHVEYQSKGVKLSEDRVFLYNRVHNEQMKVEIIDKVDDRGEPVGTVVRIYVPFDNGV